MYLWDKKYTAQGAAFATLIASTLDSAISSTLLRSEGFGASLSAINGIFVNIQAHAMYEEFLNANDNI